MKINLESGFSHKEIFSKDFGDRWPFAVDSAVVACKDSLFCVIQLDGKFFALNGAAATKYRLKTPHEAKKAEVGKSIALFIEIAKEL